MAVKYIKNEGGKYRKKKTPFALVVSMNPPHMPYDQVPQKYKDMYKDADTNLLFNRPDIPPAGTKWGNYYRKKIRNYYAMITGVDEQFGRILDALKDEGLEKNTIVLFTSDHGNCLGIHDRISKSNPYEESVRIPFIIRWNNKLTPRHDDMLISTPDIFPTLMQLMGFAKSIPTGVQGTGYSEYFLTGEGPVPESQLYYIILKGLGNTGSRGVRTSRYSLVINRFNAPDTILFDRQTDPYQFKNIATENPQIVNKLIQTELKPWLIRINDPFCDK
jgi:arylsulfatase A-like enzyme